MNSNQPHTLPPSYFDAVYQANEDPWNFETSAYEHQKYAASVAALPRPRYARALEVGCSLGVLTRKLAARCGYLLALDVAAAPLARARQRCADLPQVEFRQLRLPNDPLPDAGFDLAVLSEVGYYWDLADLTRVAEQLEQALTSGAHLLLVHWTPPVHDYPLTGDEVHDFFLNRAASTGTWRHRHGFRQATYRLDLLEKA